MTTIETAPTAAHIGAADLPFVEVGGGNKLNVNQVKPEEGMWIIENRVRWQADQGGPESTNALPIGQSSRAPLRRSLALRCPSHTK